MKWMLGGGVALFALIVGGVIYALLEGDRRLLESSRAASSSERGSQADPSAAPRDQESPVLTPQDEASILAEAKPLAKKFLEARKTAELLPLVRESQRAWPRMQRDYPGGRIEPPGMTGFNAKGNAVFGESVTWVEVITAKFESRQLAFVRTSAGLRIDWECWAGWSDMAWPTWLAERPATPQVFRVVVRRVDYYNFGFADDKQWQSYLLESPSGEHMLFGYVQRGSTLEQNFQMSPDVERVFMILKIRFPEAGTAQSSNQVIIDEKIASGWVEKNDDKP